LVDAVEKVRIFFVTEFPPNNKIRRNRKSMCPQARSFSTSKTSSLAFAGKIARTTSFPWWSFLTTSPAQISPYANFARPMMGARLITAKSWNKRLANRLSFPLSDVCNTAEQFFLRHNRAARKSKLKMQSAEVRRKSGGC
jgi:hypothetical protein